VLSRSGEAANMNCIVFVFNLTGDLTTTPHTREKNADKFEAVNRRRANNTMAKITQKTKN
jgi:hypothetical protein